MTTATHKVSASEFAHHLGTYVSKAVEGATIHVSVHGRPQVVMVSAREYEELLACKRSHGEALRRDREELRGYGGQGA